MAAPPCMSDDGRAAVFVGTFLQNGDAVALCDECMIPWSAAVFQGMTGVDMSAMLQAVSQDDELAPDDPAAAAAQTAAPPHQTQHGAPTDEPPAPAPADTDEPE